MSPSQSSPRIMKRKKQPLNNMRKFLFIAIAVLFAAACAKPSFDDAFKRAEGELGLGNFEKAAKLYGRILKDHPNDPRNAVVLLRMGDVYAYSMGNVAEGLKSYQQAIERGPQAEIARLAHERRADVFEIESKSAGMIEEYTALLKYFPDHADAPKYRMKLGESYIMSNEFQQARTELRGFVEKQGVPRDFRERALFDIGETYFLEGKPGKAVRFYHTLLQENPKSPLAGEAELRVATCLEEMGYLGMAQKFAKDAGQRYPNKEVVEDRVKGIEERGKAHPKDSKTQK